METINAEKQLQVQRYRLLPYRTEKIADSKVLVVGYFGGWTFLSEDEFKGLQAEQFSKESYQKLTNAGIVLSKENITNTIRRYNAVNQNLFVRPSLHMINTTNTCNYRCRYCHAGVSQGKDFMDIETAKKALAFIFKSSGHMLTIEFQGGECLLNWKVVKLVVEKAREINKTLKRNLNICVVSNLSLLNEEKLEFLTKHEVSICTSLDGPKKIHDENRKTVSNAPTHDKTVEKIKFVQEYYKKIGSKRRVDILATITRTALQNPKEIVDMYVDLGIPTLHLRPVQNLGDALSQWPELAYTADEFYDFWSAAMSYIVELNKKGTKIMERGAYNILRKVLAEKDAMYIEMMNPTGAGRASLLYNHDGTIFSSDEGRMIAEPIFAIGTVDEEPREVLMGKENISTWASTILDITCYHSPYRHWGGIHPVHIYQNQGTTIPNIGSYDLYQIYEKQCKFLFEKIAEDGFERRLFSDWSKKILHVLDD